MDDKDQEKGILDALVILQRLNIADENTPVSNVIECLRAANYDREAMRTRGDLNFEDMMTCGALGLAGETGEVVEIIKKYKFHNQRIDAVDLLEELGDVLLYLTLISNAYGISIFSIMQNNISKLRLRYPHGFNYEDAKRARIKRT